MKIESSEGSEAFGMKAAKCVKGKVLVREKWSEVSA
jgi:hypothetical protein